MQFTRRSWASQALTLLLQTAVVSAASTPLFQPWDVSQWVASDDNVRPGGQSQSSLEVLDPGTAANPFAETIVRFSGNLDYEALNGSGFASQRTADGWAGLDLSAYDRLVLQIPFADGKRYSLNLKDTLVEPVDGVEQASVSWEYDFQSTAAAVSAAGTYETVEVLFADLVPMYRGREQTDGAPLDLAAIKRVNIMIRR